jgi:CheY-like chemotaxis protein
MTISILVVDDVRPIAEGFAGKFRRFSEEHFHVRADVEVLCSSDEAVRRISDESLPTFDLLFTDIDLSGGDSPDKAGVAFARFAKAMIPGIPLVGCSGQFEQDDLSDEDRGIFDRWWSKGGLAHNLPIIAQDTLSRAILYHQSRQTSPITSEQDCNLVEPEATDSVLRTPRTNDEFLEEGYIKTIIEPSTENCLVEPFAVWVKNSQEGVELEVVGCGAIFSWGDTYDDAEAGLMEIIMDLKQSLHEPDESFSYSLLSAKRFVETVTGSRIAAKGV